MFQGDVLLLFVSSAPYFVAKLLRETSDENQDALEIAGDLQGDLQRALYGRMRQTAFSGNFSSPFHENLTVSNNEMRRSEAATTIQRAYRAHLAQKELSRLKLEADRKNSAACTIQRFYRGYRGRRISRQLRAERKRCSEAAVIIQSRVRGYLARRHYDAMRKNINGRLDIPISNR